MHQEEIHKKKRVFLKRYDNVSEHKQGDIHLKPLNSILNTEPLKLAETVNFVLFCLHRGEDFL